MDKQKLIRIASFSAYFIAVFLLFIFILFPFDSIKNKIESEFRRRTALELSISRISPRFFNRYVLSDVVVSDKQGKVLFESPSVNTSVSIFSLLRGGVGLDMKATAYGGQLLITMRQGSGRQSFTLDSDGLDISSYAMLKSAGLKLAGKIGGNFEMNNDAGKGRLWLKGVTSRELKIKGFPVPDLDFDKGWLEAEVKGDRLMIRKMELDGKELRVLVNGDLVMREHGTVNLVIKLKPSERLAHEQSGLLAFLKNRDPEGYYQFTLGGILSAPMPRF